jgi:hypothetical protein
MHLLEQGVSGCFLLQIDFMYDSMKDAKTKMAVMKRDLEVSREIQGRLTVQNQALQSTVDIMASAPEPLQSKWSIQRSAVACVLEMIMLRHLAKP